MPSVKTVKIGDQDIRFLADAKTCVYYFSTFKRDLFRDIQKMQTDEGIDVMLIQQLAYIMAAQGSGGLRDLSYENYLDWLGQFDAFDVINQANEIVSIYAGQRTATAKPKKKEGQQSGS